MSEKRKILRKNPTLVNELNTSIKKDDLETSSKKKAVKTAKKKKEETVKELAVRFLHWYLAVVIINVFYRLKRSTRCRTTWI